MKRWASTQFIIDLFLDLTTQTATAFWVTSAFCAGWITWNHFAFHPFDPYPFGLLTLAFTIEGILQNIIIMTRQRLTDRIAQRQEDIDRKQAGRMLTMMETQSSIGEVLLEHARRAEERDLASIQRDTAILAAVEKGSGSQMA